MKKNLVSTLLCAALTAAMLAGCGSSSAPADTGAGAPAAEDTGSGAQRERRRRVLLPTKRLRSICSSALLNMRMRSGS